MLNRYGLLYSVPGTKLCGVPAQAKVALTRIFDRLRLQPDFQPDWFSKYKNEDPLTDEQLRKAYPFSHSIWAMEITMITDEMKRDYLSTKDLERLLQGCIKMNFRHCLITPNLPLPNVDPGDNHRSWYDNHTLLRGIRQAFLQWENNIEHHPRVVRRPGVAPRCMKRWKECWENMPKNGTGYEMRFVPPATSLQSCAKGGTRA